MGESDGHVRRGGSVANVGVLPVPMLPISNWGLKLAGYGAGRIGLIYYSAKGKLRWRQNADIAVRRVTGTDARMAQTGFTSIVMTRSTVNGAVLQVTDMGARMARIGFTGMVRVATSVSGAARPQTARAAHTPLRTAMKSDVYGGQ